MRICAIAERMERRVMLAVTPGPEFRVNTFVDNDQIHPATAMDAAGNFVIVWQSGGQDAPPSLSPGIFGQRYNAAGAPVGPEFLVNTVTDGSQTLPAVAMNPSGDFVVAWEGGDAAALKGVFAQRFNAAGVKQGPEFRANTHVDGQQANPAVAIDADGDIVIAWQSFGQDHPLPGTDYGIYAQRFNAAGAPQGVEFQVNTYTALNQFYPSVAMDNAGDFVIAWHSGDQGPGDTNQVYAQRYNAAGAPQGGNFRVSSTYNYDQQFPSVAMDADGDFVVAWACYGNVNEGTLGVLVQRYSAAGAPLTGPILANTQPGKSQRHASVANDADGDFVVAWQSEETVPPSGIVAMWGQQFTSGGARIGGNFQVNSSPTGGQPFPSVAMDADGDFIVAWQTYGLDSPAPVRRGGVYARHYSEPHAPRVTQVYVRGAAWAAPFMSYLAGVPGQAAGSGQYGYAVGGGAAQLGDFPWYNLNQVSIAFSSDVTVAQRHLSVRGVNVANYPVTGFAYNPSTYTATWTLGREIPADKLLLDLDGDVASGGVSGGGMMLDGDWSTGGNFPSGNGAAGGDFRFRLNVLPGDVDRSGSVLANDFSEVKKKFFTSTAAPGPAGAGQYSVLHDVDGSGSILANDFSEVKKRFFNALPGPDPTGASTVPLARRRPPNADLFSSSPVPG